MHTASVGAMFAHLLQIHESWDICACQRYHRLGEVVQPDSLPQASHARADLIRLVATVLGNARLSSPSVFRLLSQAKLALKKTKVSSALPSCARVALSVFSREAQAAGDVCLCRHFTLSSAAPSAPVSATDPPEVGMLPSIFHRSYRLRLSLTSLFNFARSVARRTRRYLWKRLDPQAAMWRKDILLPVRRRNHKRGPVGETPFPRGACRARELGTEECPPSKITSPNWGYLLE
jgi:hypothetical protein